MVHNDNSVSESTENNSDEKQNLSLLFLSLYSGLKSDSALVSFVMLNLVFTVLRFHDFSGMGFIGSLRLPALVSVICMALVLPKLSQPWPKQMKVMLVLILFELTRGVIGYAVLPDMVLNDGWQMHILGDIVLNVLTIVMPLAFAFNSGVRLRKVLNFLLVIGIMLGLWSITHAGHGPGGYLGDENDNCLVLVYLLPIPFFMFSQTRSFIVKLICLFSGLALVLGSVFTNSRGGFLGLVMVILFQFLLSRSKIKWLAGAGLVTLISLPLIPAEYWKEIYSIKTESSNKSGTIQERLDTWEITTRMWLDPRNTLFGTGLENAKWNMNRYEDAEAGHSKRSLAGREAHCLYFQILGDLGIWGVVTFGMIIILSIKQLRAVRRETRYTYSLLNSESMQNIPAKLEDLVKSVRKEMIFLDGLASTILCSWLGALSAAIGISVAYYPTVWFLSGISMAIYLYWISIRDKILSNILGNRRLS